MGSVGPVCDPEWSASYTLCSFVETPGVAWAKPESWDAGDSELSKGKLDLKLLFLWKDVRLEFSDVFPWL